MIISRLNGLFETNAFVRVPSVPEIPQNVTALAFNSKNVKVAWSKSENATMYTVFWYNALKSPNNTQVFVE